MTVQASIERMPICHGLIDYRIHVTLPDGSTTVAGLATSRRLDNGRLAWRVFDVFRGGEPVERRSHAGVRRVLLDLARVHPLRAAAA